MQDQHRKSLLIHIWGLDWRALFNLREQSCRSQETSGRLSSLRTGSGQARLAEALSREKEIRQDGDHCTGRNHQPGRHGGRCHWTCVAASLENVGMREGDSVAYHQQQDPEGKILDRSRGRVALVRQMKSLAASPE